MRQAPSPNVSSSSPTPTPGMATRRMPAGSSARSPGVASPRTSTRLPAHYRQALALAEEVGMRPLQAHCHRGLGTLYRHDRPGGAGPCRAVDSDRRCIRPWTMTFWLPQTEAALAQVEGR